MSRAEPSPEGPDWLTVQVATARAVPAETVIADWVRAVLGSAPPGPHLGSHQQARHMAGEPAGFGDICIRFVDDDESAALNHTYRGKVGPTNVLSFPADIDWPEGRVWGDLVLAAPLVEREAYEQGKAVHDHQAHLIMHGVLHLVGYDHQRPGEARRMERRERELLARFGIGDPYADAAAARAPVSPREHAPEHASEHASGDAPVNPPS